MLENLAAGGVYLDCKNKILEERVACSCAILDWGSFEMDWLLFGILVAAVGAHLIVAGFGR